MKSPLKYLFTLGLPLALVIGGVAWLRNPAMLQTGGSKPGITYDEATVAKGPIRRVVATSGPVRALVTVSVGSELSGKIDTMKVDFNTEVKAGDVLATIDPRTFEARAAQARADLAAARAALTNQEAALNKAKSVRDLATLNQKRQEALQQKGFSATASLDTANRDVGVAIADIEVAKAQIESAKAVIIQREAALRQADVDLERTRIVSPINGTVISRTVDLGQTVAASFQAPELFKIAQDLRRIRIEAQVNEADVGAVVDGNPVSFSVDAYPDRTFEGKVTQVRLSATELQNIVTYTVIIEASNDDRRLFPGMTANVQIETAKKDDALRIPNDALRFKLRNEASEQTGGGGGANRGERMLSKLKTDLELTDEQEKAVRDEIGKMFAERSAAPGGMDTSIADPAAMRQRMQALVERTLTPLLSAEQRPLLEKWKRGRENTKSGSVYVRSETGALDRRFVRLGISDDQFTEIASGELKEGERVVTRAREAAK
jgi:HlyD family secretion protein